MAPSMYSEQKTADTGMDMYDEEEADVYDDDDGTDAESSTHLSMTRGSSTSHDEKKEVYKMSAKDTRRVQCGRAGALLVLLLTAMGVTWTTYMLLEKEETSNFVEAFEKFSRTVGDAAIEQQRKYRDSLRSLANVVSGIAKSQNMTWPLIDIGMFEVYGNDAMAQANSEFISIWPRIYPETKDAFTWFTTVNYKETIQESHMIKYGNLDKLDQDELLYKPFISQKTPDGLYVPDEDRDDYFAAWQFSPPLFTYGIVNWNCASVPPVRMAVEAMKEMQYETSFTVIMPYHSIHLVLSKEDHDGLHSKLLDSTTEHPHCLAYHPIHEDPTDPTSEIVGLVNSGIALDASLLDLLPNGVEGIIAVIKNNMNQSVTYEIIGPDAVYLGEGDLHEEIYNDMRYDVDLALHTNPDYLTTPGNVRYHMEVYPSSRFNESYKSTTPEMYAAVVAITFALVAFMFLLYDIAVTRRNENLVSKAAQSNAIVSSLFPESIKKRLMTQQENEQQNRSMMRSKKGNLKAFLNTGEQLLTQKPLADLFLETTVLFADIAGFTAWSSVRDPSQVFSLLETLYQAFDAIAKRRKVFKVETVGDCYVACCGLPDPRPDHAQCMARFAQDILNKMSTLTKQLEVALGPDTGDLKLRIGMHSGPVTAGVLRGEKARFQLFGDTVNTCARLEASSAPSRILCSKETAELLRKAGKEAWLQKGSCVLAKGKGIMEAYWVNVSGNKAGSVVSQESIEALKGKSMTLKYGKPMQGLNDRTSRLVNWNVEVLLEIMQQIAAHRIVSPPKKQHSKFMSASSTRNSTTPLEEVKEIIALPAFDRRAAKANIDASEIKIPGQVCKELHLYVSHIAAMYNDNPFHNFDHASHVVMSVIKLLGRIVAPNNLDNETAAVLHDHTYGITSDPLTQFACAFSALIHDVDHVGVSNAQLVKEGVPIAELYKERSVAEQNSLDLSWNLLMEPTFELLRAYLFPTPAELARFRQLVVNSVMSTDIVDQDLKALRNSRWEKAFKGEKVEENPRDVVNRKATIVIEHIIQASDISHTMQHWHVYRKWNQNLFEELYVAYLNGRMEKDPSDFWYKGEFGFFDFYIIPLTKKLKDCGVFGVSSDEYYNYAIKNREEWEAKGEEVVASMTAECHRKYGVKAADIPKPPSDDGMEKNQ